MVPLRQILVEIKSDLQLYQAIKAILLIGEADSRLEMLGRIKLFNKVKRVLHNCASSAKEVNRQLLLGLMQEIWLNIKVAKAGLCCNRLKREFEPTTWN